MFRNSLKLFQFGKVRIHSNSLRSVNFLGNCGPIHVRNTLRRDFHQYHFLNSCDELNSVQKFHFHPNITTFQSEEKNEQSGGSGDTQDPVFQYLLYGSIAAVIVLLSYHFAHRRKMLKKIEKVNMLRTIQRIRESGILASDENAVIMENRFSKLGIKNTDENRREYREVLYNSPGIEKYCGGAILCRETFDQKTKSGERFVDLLNKKGIHVGLCVDDGWNVDPKTGESLTRGMKDLHREVKHAKDGGASFVKWRTVFHMTTDNSSPSPKNMKQNIDDIIKYVQIAQSYGLVPIVEPEVSVFASEELTIDQVHNTTQNVLFEVFQVLQDPKNGTDVSRIILKPNMVVNKKFIDNPYIVGEMTISAFQKAKVPNGMSIMFLSGGMNEKQSKENLNQISKCNSRMKHNMNWRFSYSFGRALQASCRSSWRGKKENTEEARNSFIKQARDCYFASYGMMNEQ